jgi:hypothetical protein
MDKDKIKRGKEKYVESCERLGVKPDTARKRADNWETATRQRQKKNRA